MGLKDFDRLWRVERLMVLLVVSSFSSWAIDWSMMTLGYYETSLQELLGFSPSLPLFVRHPWSIVTYLFLHLDLWHLGFNILLLHGLRCLGIDDYLEPFGIMVLMLLGTALGGLCYLVGYNALFYLDIYHVPRILIGASSGIMALGVAFTYLQNRNHCYKLWGYRLRQRPLFFVVISLVLLIMLITENIGGLLAHIGGCVSGFVFVWYVRLYPHISSRLLTPLGIGIADLEEHQSVSQLLMRMKQSGYKSLSPAERASLIDANTQKNRPNSDE